MTERMPIADWQADCYSRALEKGWWDEPTKAQRRAERELAFIALRHRTLSRVLEAVRKGSKGHPPSEISPYKLREYVLGLNEEVVSDLARMALIHSEVTEAIDCILDGTYEQTGGEERHLEAVESDFEMTKPEGAVVELADVVIRVLDWCGHKKLDLEKAIADKHAYNGQRKYRHGGKLA